MRFLPDNSDVHAAVSANHSAAGWDYYPEADARSAARVHNEARAQIRVTGSWRERYILFVHLWYSCEVAIYVWRG